MMFICNAAEVVIEKNADWTILTWFIFLYSEGDAYFN